MLKSTAASLFYLLSLLLLPFLGSGQKLPQGLSLNQLITFHKSEQTTVNDALLAKDWDFEKASKETADEYGSITWAYRVYKHTEEAQAFMEITLWDNEIIKIRYQVASPQVIKSIKSEIASNKMVKVKSGVDDEDHIFTDYVGANYAVRVGTGKDSEGNRMFQVFLCSKEYYYRNVYGYN